MKGISMEYTEIAQGVQMPMVGFGTSFDGVKNPEPFISEALVAGYRSFDTAQVYKTEAPLGRAIAASGISREELFLTTKIWITHEKTVADAMASIDASLARLQTDYIDLLMVHQPFGNYYAAYQACEEALAAGKARAIGVSNFYADRIADLCRFVSVKPAVDQIETHVFDMRLSIRKVLDQYGVKQMAWAPFARGAFNIFKNPVLSVVAAKHEKSVGQVALRYLIQRGIIVIPKSSNPERMRENLNVFDFTLDGDDMAAITTLNEEKTAFFNHYDPDLIGQMLTWESD